MAGVAIETNQVSGARLGRVTLALFMAGFATFSLIYSTQPLLGELARQFRLDPATSSLALSATTATLAVSILAMGALSESFGRRGLMFASMGAAAVLNLACALAPTWTALVGERAIEGLALGGVPATAMAYLAEEIPPQRLGFAMGLYVSGNAFGGMAGRVAVGALTQLWGWRAALGSVSALDLAAALAFVLLLPASRNFAARRGLALRAHFAAWGGHLLRPGLAMLFAVGFLSMGSFVSVYNYIGFRLAAPPYGLSQGQIGLIFLTYLIGMAASSWAGALADRFGRARVLSLGAVIALAGLALTLAPPLALIALGVAGLTAGFFVAHSVASGWVGHLALTNRSLASSLYLLAYYLGASVMGSAGGAAWHWAGWTALTAYCAAGMLAVLAIGVALGRTAR
ncbi:MAG TPA: MFS transporter [Caulobacteraceae bacterium]|jgi:YNFM family putative membrane transporter|nr:MFS transporter [Caulobacteraceae bacterium]